MSPVPHCLQLCLDDVWHAGYCDGVRASLFVCPPILHSLHKMQYVGCNDRLLGMDLLPLMTKTLCYFSLLCE
jgi:hypothetical protein